MKQVRNAVVLLLMAVVFVGPRSALGQAIDWPNAEKHALANQTQITFAERFFKAGESYFSPDDSMVIFQAVEVPQPGEEAQEYYGMYVGDVIRDESGRMTGLDNFKLLSPPGSANTCGWFHPTKPNIVIFGSTIGPPTMSAPPGYQRGSGRYRWMFPPEMDIVECNINEANGTADSLKVLLGSATGYIAECSFSRDGRHLLFCSLEENQGDLYTLDVKTGIKTALVNQSGYDGGPFFSPDGRRICYRSDRRGNNLLQIFIAELIFNRQGTIVGIEREYQLTDNEHVNWAPYWHPEGRHLVYATSEAGHQNYEVFIIDADPGNLNGMQGTVRYGTRKRRITAASGFDGLPVFDSSGKTMLWTSQRGEDGRSQLWVADFVFDIDADPALAIAEPVEESEESEEITVTDPESGLIYMYNPRTHGLNAYDPTTHLVREVTSDDEIAKAMKLFGREGG